MAIVKLNDVTCGLVRFSAIVSRGGVARWIVGRSLEYKNSSGDEIANVNFYAVRPEAGLPLSFLSWAYVFHRVYFWVYGSRRCRFSAFSYAKPSHFRRIILGHTRNDEAVGIHNLYV